MNQTLAMALLAALVVASANPSHAQRSQGWMYESGPYGTPPASYCCFNHDPYHMNDPYERSQPPSQFRTWGQSWDWNQRDR
jgi:hypothetical protein